MKKNIIIISLAIVILIITITSINYFSNKERSSQKINISTIMPNFTKKEFTDIIKTNSSGVIVGTVESLNVEKEPSNFTPNQIDIVTNATINVDKYIFNPKNLSYGQLIIQTIGGKIDNEEMIAEHAAKFLIGEKVVIILDKAINNNKFTILGWANGKYSIDENNSIEFFGEKITINNFEEYINSHSSAK